jgi:RHS repeat-associated protein
MTKRPTVIAVLIVALGALFVAGVLPGPVMLQAQPDNAGRRSIPIQALVIPEDAFIEASASSHFRVDRPTMNAAARLAGIANAPGTLGVVSTVRRSDQPQDFSGTVFIVTRDVREPPGNGQSITSRDYYVAAVELSGRSAWIGNAAFLLSDNALASAANNLNACCGPSTVCVPDSITSDPCGPDGFCSGPDLAIGQNPPPQQGLRGRQGLLRIPLQVLDSGVGRRTLFTGSCNDRIGIGGKSCGIAKPTCEPGDVGYLETSTGTADIPLGSACGLGSKQARGKEMPDWCTYASFEGPAPECDGPRWESPLSSFTRVAQTTIAGMRTSDFLPPMCSRARVFEGSNVCTTAQEQAQQKELDNAMLRATFGFTGGRRCERTGTSVNNWQGRFATSQCVECEAGLAGQCRQWIELVPMDRDECKNECTMEDEPIDVPRPPPPPPTDPIRDVRNEERQQFQQSKQPRTGSGPVSTQNINSNTPPSPDPNKPKPGANTRTNGLDAFNRDKKRDKASVSDPVLLADGAFDLVHRDLSFPGPTQPLEFVRTYNSRSDDKGTLGSNWIHNWDVWLEPLNTTNTPAWAMPYCLGADSELFPRFSSATPDGDPRVTCLLLHRGDASSQLFFLDLGTRLYMPQAGRTETITTTKDGGWAIRSRDGSISLFNREGYLIEDRDRFGNGFHIDYEPTPLWEMYTTYCSPDQLVQRNETKHARRCAFLAHLVGDGPAVSARQGWTLDLSDYPVPVVSLDPAELARRQRLQYARAYLLHLVGQGPQTMAAYGTRRMRPIRVRDDVGRTLLFDYVKAPACTLSHPCNAPYDFAGKPEAELLMRVTGPADTSVSFEYSRPSLPSDRGERFLVFSVRQDATATVGDVTPSPRRSFTYHYQWPGGPVPSFEAFGTTVYDKYLQFYRTFAGCTLAPLTRCGELGLPQISPGDPEELARIAEYGYISSLIDNIIQVDETPIPSTVAVRGPTPSIQSETRYETDPWSASFDRAYAQRHGSSQAQQNSARIAPDLPWDNWQSGLPKATFRYAGGTGSRDVPSAVLDRYPLEPVPVAAEVPTIPQAAGCPSSIARIPECDFNRMESLRTELPGWKPPVAYFDAPVRHPQVASRLFRTPLACEQLAAGTYGDPTHNDLMTSLEPITATPALFDHTARRIVGRRAVTAADANRICAWSQVTDRNGDSRYFGLNFMGQILVNAVRERKGTGFVFSETLYTADGMVAVQRRPQRGTRPWQPSDGYTLYQYDEIDPSGHQGWDAWLPVFWSRRMNLVRIEEHPKGERVLDFDEKSQDFRRTFGRYQAFQYEPLFNQLKRAEYGSLQADDVRPIVVSGTVRPPIRREPREPSEAARLEPAAVGPFKDVPHETVTLIFDYQELSASAGASAATSVDPVLDHWIRWGFAWSVTPAGTYDYADITSWQLPLRFYDQDLNGDGVRGSIALEPYQRARGVPIMILREGDDPALPARTSLITWSRNGQIASLRGPGGDFMTFDYYSLAYAGTPEAYIFGGTSEPTSAVVSNLHKGFPARVQMLRFNADPPNVVQASAPCARLAGPYQWLLPASCANPQQELAQLGLPPQAVQAILAAADAARDPSSADAWETVTFSYNRAGGVRYQWSNGRATHFIRDADGRVRRTTDPAQNTTEHAYSVRGLPKAIDMRDASGVILSELRQSHDETGAPVYHCAATAPGGCDATPKTGSERTFKYTPEGALRESVDPEGLVSTYEYDEMGLLTFERHAHPQFPADPAVELRRTYNDDGLRTGTTYAPGTPIELSDRSSYDGLGRLTSYVDVRGYGWQRAFTTRDLLARRKRDNVPYGSPGGGSQWETVLEHDAFQDLQRVTHDGVETLRLRRTPGGRVYALTSAGLGETLLATDLTDRPAWVRDPSGTETVFTRRTNGLEETTSLIRRSGSNRLTTSTIIRLDALERPTTRIEYGAGQQQIRSWTRVGRNISEQSPEGLLTDYEFDLQDLLRKLRQQKTTGVTPPQFETTTFDYDRRGQLKSVTDDAQQETTYDYDGLGRLKERRSLGQQPVRREFSYDALGRLDVETFGASRIRHLYDPKGDPTQDILLGSTTPQLIAERQYDELGRLKEARNLNAALSTLGAAQRTVVRTVAYDALGQIRSDRLKVGTQAEHEVASDWSVLPSGTWERKIRYAMAGATSEWREAYDNALRLSQKRPWGPGGAAQGLTFSWMGGLYQGRDQAQAGRQTPFRERVQLDAFGAPIGWRATAIDVQPNGQPTNAQDGTAYCGGTWNTAQCGRPLLQLDALRDVASRVVSLHSQLGHPTFSAGTLIQRTPARPWRGYGYDPRGRLGRLWEHPGVGTTVSTAGLTTHQVTTAQIEAAAATSMPWMYDREPPVGGTLAIRNAQTNAARWTLPAPRGPGHQLQQTRVDGNTRSQQHNSAGELTRDGDLEYIFDPRGQLAAVRRNGQLVEAYFYDDQGRLAGTASGPTMAVAQVFAYDRLQMVAAFDSANRPLWEAVWGPALDQLVSWRDIAGGTGEYIPLVESRNSVIGSWHPPTSRLTQSADYDPEGRLTLNDAASTQLCIERGSGQICTHPGGMPFGFTSAWRSRATGLIYMRNRWYSPTLGQFVSQEPLTASRDPNTYRFGGGDPINRFDPLGLDWKDFKSFTASWHEGVDRAASKVGSWVQDDASHGNPDVYGPAVLATVAATVVSFVGHGLALGPDAVIGLSQIPADLDKSRRYDAEAGEALRAGQYETAAWSAALSVLYNLKAAGSFANAIVLVHGAGKVGAARLSPPPLKPITVGEIKPANMRGVDKAFKQINDWRISRRGDGTMSLVHYDEAGNVTLQRYRYNPGTEPQQGVWEIDGPLENVGKIKMPKDVTDPMELGRRVEEPIRDLVSKKTGVPFKSKTPQANGPDLIRDPSVVKPKPRIVPDAPPADNCGPKDLVCAQQ